jgi:hypothetical protein
MSLILFVFSKMIKTIIWRPCGSISTVTAYRLKIHVVRNYSNFETSRFNFFFFSGKKLVFGRVVVGPGSEQWDKAFQTPTLTRTQWHSIR